MGAEEWGPLIRRCVLNDRDSLLSDFSALMQPSAQVAPDVLQRLTHWHQEGEKRFLQLLPKPEKLRWPVPIKYNRYQLSYLISVDDAEALPIDSLSQVLEKVNRDVRDTVRTGWSMFYPFSGAGIAPAFHPERSDGTGADILETNLMGEYRIRAGLPDFWRVAPDGRATLIRAYNEERMSSIGASPRSAGTWLSLKRSFGKRPNSLPMRGCWRDNLKRQHGSASVALGLASKNGNLRISILQFIGLLVVLRRQTSVRPRENGSLLRWPPLGQPLSRN